MTDDWTMADGFAPVSRLHYCEHPKACSAPVKGPCPRCQKAAYWVKRKLNQKHSSRLPYHADVALLYVDEDFDTWGVR